MIYLMLNIPFVFWVKIGFSGKKPFTRARKVDRDAPGVPIIVFFVPVPGAIYIEKEFHRWLRVFRVTFYRGDGHTEWYWLPAALPVLAFGLLVWWGYFEACKYIVFLITK